MNKRKIGLIIGVLCFLMASTAVYEIMVITGFFETGKQIISEALFDSEKQSPAKPPPANRASAKQVDEDHNFGTKLVILTWDNVPNATSYNVYWSNTKGVTKRNGNKIPAVKNVATITNLKAGRTYYFVATAVNESGESRESNEVVYKVE